MLRAALLLLATALPQRAGAPDSVAERYRRALAGEGLDEFHRGVESVALAGAGPRLPSLDVPVLLAWGETDRGPPEVEQEWLAGLSRGEVLCVPGAGHWPFCENPEVFFPAVESFLGR